MRLILASSSPRRLDLLKSIHIIPDLVISPDIDETELKNELPHNLAKRLSYEKNMAVKKDYPNDLVLTADTVVAKGRRILPKAETEEDFYNCMKLISGGRHQAMTSVTISGENEKIITRLVKTVVKIKRLTNTEIENFKKTNEWHSKAGGYALQGYFGQYIEFISGSYSAVIGLPVSETAKILESLGYLKK